MESEEGRACGTHGKREETVQGFGGEAKMKETLMKHRWMGSELILGTGWGCGVYSIGS
jgi:hypothetical protein